MNATLTSNIATSSISSMTAGVSSSTTDVASIPSLPLGEEIYDILDPVSINYPYFDILKKVLFIIISIILLYYFYKWLISPVIKRRDPIVQSAEHKAIRAIKRLKLSDKWKNNDFKSICENVAAILKNYTLDAYKISLGSAATTDEYISDIINANINNSILANVRNLLSFCDEVRYVGNNADRLQKEELIQILEMLINTEGWF